MSNPVQYRLIQTVSPTVVTSSPMTVSVTNTQVGSLLIIGAFVNSVTNIITSITDNGGNTWALAIANKVDTARDVEIWYARNTNPTNTITINYGGAGSNLDAYMREYGGLSQSSSVLDRTKTSQGSGTALDTGATSTRQDPNELLVCCGSVSNTAAMSVGTNFGNFVNKVCGASTGRIGLEDQTVSITGTDNGTMTGGSGTWEVCIATFVIASGKFAVSSNNLGPYPFSPGRSR